MDAICPEDYSMAVWSQPITAIMGSVMKGKRGVTGRFALWKELLFYFQFSLKFSPLQWQSLPSGAHLALMGTVCLLSRAASWWQLDWSDAAAALPGEVELCAVLVAAVTEEVTMVCRLLVRVACPGENNVVPADVYCMPATCWALRIRCITEFSQQLCDVGTVISLTR